MSERSKDYFAQRTTNEMAQHIKVTDLTVQQQLAVTARMLALDGHESGLAGQISARAADSNTFWTLKLGLGFDEANPSDFIRVDDDLNTVEGDGMANPATRFHLWVYRERGDVNAIVHTHPPFTSALSMLEEPLIVAHMDQTPFFNDCAFLAEWPGVPIADDEGRIICEALQDKHTIILAHHGFLTATESVRESCYLAVLLERAARMQLRASAVGKIKPVPDDLAAEAGAFLRQPGIVNGTFEYYIRRTQRHFGDFVT